MKIRTLIVSAFALCISIGLPILALAQGDPGMDPDPIPLDGGLSLLIGAGVAYGVKKAYDKKKKDKAAE